MYEKLLYEKFVALLSALPKISRVIELLVTN